MLQSLLLPGPAPGRRVPLAGAGPAHRRARRRRRLDARRSRIGVEADPGAPVPADSPAARIRQMRALAQEFTGRQTNRKGVDSDMRLLAQPIYRYENTKGDVIDGGLFVFVQGTDPEVFLLIEARRPPGGARSGVSAPPECTASICGSITGAAIWNAPEITWEQVQDRREPYTIFRFETPAGTP